MVLRHQGRAFAAAILLTFVSSWASCGYQLAGRADTLPDTVGVIAIPPFQNHTVEFKVEQEDTVYPMVPAGADLHDMIRRPSLAPIVETASDE